MLALSSFSAPARTTYTYTGDVFIQSYEGSPGVWPTSGRITATITFESKLMPDQRWEETTAPIAWSISDGVHTIDNTSSAISRIYVATNGDGNIFHWQLEAFARDTQGIVGLVTYYNGKTVTDFSILLGSDETLKGFAYNDSSAGAWIEAASAAVSNNRPPVLASEALPGISSWDVCISNAWSSERTCYAKKGFES